MPRNCSHLMYSLVKLLTVVLLIPLICLAAVQANEITERRVKISLPMFPKIVAVDSNFNTKLTAENRARLVFIYDKNKLSASVLASQLADSHKKIVNVAIETLHLPLYEQINPDATKPTAIFVAERLADTDFRELVVYGIKNKIIIFSPFSGDVERGATVGLAITSRVFPYFNANTLKQSGVRINPLLLEMSKVYE